MLTRRRLTIAGIGLGVMIVLVLLIVGRVYATLKPEIDQQLNNLLTIEAAEFKTMSTNTPACAISLNNQAHMSGPVVLPSKRKYMDVWLITTNRITPLMRQKYYQCIVSLPMMP